MKILITGINGFIGQHLSEKLIEHGYKVLGLENKNGGVLNKKLVERAIKNAEVVIHLAALTSHKDIIDNKFETLETNFLGTKNVLDAFSKSKTARKFIYASTGKVYGKIDRLPIKENHQTNPLNILGKSKLITEKLIDFYNDKNKEFVVFRIFQVYGPNQKENFLIPAIISQINLGRKEIMLGDIKAKRDYVYIDDLVDAFVKVIERKVKKGLSTYNICTGLGSSASDIIRLIEKILSRKIKIKVNKNLFRADEMMEEYGSYERAKKELYWVPKTTLNMGIKNIITQKKLQGVIIAGGKGTRMKSVSTMIPKVLLPHDGKPLLDYLVDHLKKNQVKNIIICTGYLGDKVKDYVLRKDFGVNVQVSREAKPLGSAGALHLIEKSLEEEFLVIYGDIYTKINLQKMFSFHKNNNADVTIALHKSDHPNDSTVVKVGKDNRVLNFIEKPGDDWIKYGDLTATSLYIMKKNVLKFITKNKSVDFAKDVFPKMLKRNKRIFGYVTKEYAKDMGTPERYKKVEEYILGNK